MRRTLAMFASSFSSVRSGKRTHRAGQPNIHDRASSDRTLNDRNFRLRVAGSRVFGGTLLQHRRAARP
jgi:hypothetical protein